MNIKENTSDLVIAVMGILVLVLVVAAGSKAEANNNSASTKKETGSQDKVAETIECQESGLEQLFVGCNNFF